VRALQRATGCARIYERSDSDVRRLEGLLPVERLAARRGAEDALSIVENGVRIGLTSLPATRPVSISTSATTAC
jgi:23S rRNA (cytosine1962-C5)-methyltransferase